MSSSTPADDDNTMKMMIKTSLLWNGKRSGLGSIIIVMRKNSNTHHWSCRPGNSIFLRRSTQLTKSPMNIREAGSGELSAKNTQGSKLDRSLGQFKKNAQRKGLRNYSPI